jgi:hypothetical protein
VVLLRREDSGAFKPVLQAFVIAELCPHQTFPEFAVIGDADVEQFVDNHVVLQVPRL